MRAARTIDTWRERCRWAGWLALLVIGLAMLAPTVSRALPRGVSDAMPAGWVEVCTSTGLRWVHLETGETVEKGGAPGKTLLDDCPLCWLAWDRLAPPPLPATPVLRTDLTHRAPLHAAPAARVPLRSLSGRPRGPPLLIHPFFVA
ncbi:MAG: DUF2946 domain-containing protein [Pseudomonadota bacterium]|nr:DUF2946 domain-containing protein [Pseudomonadota bacterium]